MWQKLGDDDSIHDQDNHYSWDEAFVKIATLNTPPCFANHCDWRLPNINELLTTLNFALDEPRVDPVFDSACVADCAVTSCSCPADHWWSSTTLVDYEYRDRAWTLNAEGTLEPDRKLGLVAQVRAVRGGRERPLRLTRGAGCARGDGNERN